jgi:hypothetical protein
MPVLGSPSTSRQPRDREPEVLTIAAEAASGAFCAVPGTAAIVKRTTQTARARVGTDAPLALSKAIIIATVEFRRGCRRL